MARGKRMSDIAPLYAHYKTIYAYRKYKKTSNIVFLLERAIHEDKAREASISEPCGNGKNRGTVNKPGKGTGKSREVSKAPLAPWPTGLVTFAGLPLVEPMGNSIGKKVATVYAKVTTTYRFYRRRKLKKKMRFRYRYGAT